MLQQNIFKVLKQRNKGTRNEQNKSDELFYSLLK